jgi:hypothetical protein
MRLFLTLLVLAVAGYILVHMGAFYASSTGTPWQRLLATAKNSATIFIQFVGIIGTAILTAVSYLADAVNLPEVKSWMSSLPSEWVGFAAVAFMVVTIFGRMRSLPATSGQNAPDRAGLISTDFARQ